MVAGRPRQFDPDAVLDGAVELFWERGFQGLKVPELVERLGICRQSFYRVFGDKRAFYLRAVERYAEMTLTPLVATLTAEDQDPVLALRGFVEAWGQGPCAQRGCLLVSAIGGARSDPDLARILCRKRDRLIQALTVAATRAQRAGRLDASASPSGIAHVLTTIGYGIGALAPLPGSVSNATEVRAQMLDLIDRWTTVETQPGAGSRP